MYNSYRYVGWLFVCTTRTGLYYSADFLCFQSTLRLLDGSLLCQLMSLNAALSEYRAQEERFLSENSDIIIIEDEDDFEEDSSGIITNGTITLI